MIITVHPVKAAKSESLLATKFTSACTLLEVISIKKLLGMAALKSLERETRRP
jgi:hypothetical protein